MFLLKIFKNSQISELPPSLFFFLISHPRAHSRDQTFRTVAMKLSNIMVSLLGPLPLSFVHGSPVISYDMGEVLFSKSEEATLQSDLQNLLEVGLAFAKGFWPSPSRSILFTFLY